MYDLVVIGGGAGGIEAARLAAGVGARVALIERNDLGGARSVSAGVPSKALLRAAHAFREVERAGRFGVKCEGASVDFAAALERAREVAREAGEQITAADLAARGIDVHRGTARFESYDAVLVDEATRVTGRRFAIATGSREATPKLPGLAEAGYLDSVSVWGLSSLPESLIVIGARPEGVEFAQAFARFGARVTLVTEAATLLPGEEPESSERLGRALGEDGVRLITGAQLGGVSVKEGRKVLTYREATSTGPVEVSGTDILVAARRWANVDGLGLEAVGVRADCETGVEVDDYLQTRTPNIYALGDVIGRHRWAHAAEREAATLFQNAVLRLPRKVELAAVPRVLFTSPEVASVGLTEAEASEEIRDALTWHAELAHLDRALIDGSGDGFAKVVTTATGKILGATVVAPHAALLLQEIVFAMEHGLGLGAVARTVHPYPTYGGLIQAVARQYLERRGEGSRFRAALRWFHGYQGRERNGGASSEAPGAVEEPAEQSH